MVDPARRRFFGVTLAALATCGACAARGDDTAPAPVAGSWQGPWYLGMTSGIATLVLEQGALPGGSLQLTNNEAFGPEARPLQDISIVDGRLRFRVKGADGRLLSADLPMSGQGRALKGFAKYGGYNIRLELVRSPG
jgi:hypothetical protein